MGNDRRKKAAAPAMSADRKSYKVSDNVTVKAKRGRTLDASTLTGAAQARQENARTSAPTGAGSKTSNARGLKAANEIKKVPMENVSKTATRIFGVPTTAGKPKMVAPGSKKAAKLKAKSEWSDAYEKKIDAKFDAQMAKEKSRRESGKK
jgi:hypothetical protein